MPGLVRGIARTAVIAGTASAVSGNVHHRQEERWASQNQQAYAQQPQYAQPQQYAAPAASQADLQATQAQLAQTQAQLAALQAQQVQAAIPQQPPAPAPVAQAAPATGPDLMGKLQQLSQMHDAGVLNDDEFAAAKAKLLGG